jgi:predicted transcriptional regulator
LELILDLRGTIPENLFLMMVGRINACGNCMRLKEIAEILQGTVLTKTYDGEVEISSGGAADLMSDVLAYTIEGNSILLSGLVTQQVLRTCEMAGITAIIFVRGKQPQQRIIDLAEELSIPLITSKHSMYKSCGLLFQAGLADNGISDLSKHEPT